jgi:hypothetical protein
MEILARSGILRPADVPYYRAVLEGVPCWCCREAQPRGTQLAVAEAYTGSPNPGREYQGLVSLCTSCEADLRRILHRERADGGV